MARLDTCDTRDNLRERYPVGSKTFTRSMLPPEEITTFNLMRRIAFWQSRGGGTFAATVHSKALEGGLEGKRPPSGADLELAVEVAPGTWVDLLLQAKRIFENGSYDGWKVAQIGSLRDWAARNGDRTPGMLLYNAEIAPFGPPGHDVDLGGCGMSPIRCYGRHWPSWSPPDSRSPLGITLVVLPKKGSRAQLPRPLSGDALPAERVNKYASPFECIFCPARLRKPTVSRKSARVSRVVSAIEPKTEIPEWANTLLAALEQQSDTAEPGLSLDDERWDARYSLVLPYVG